MDLKSSAANYPSFISQHFRWWFLEVPGNIFHGTIQVVTNTYNYFSINLLFKTLFAPWKRDIVDSSHFSLAEQLQVMVMNLISRLLGAIIRFITIVVGLLITFVVFLLGIIWLIVFVLIPFIAVFIIALQLFTI